MSLDENSTKIIELKLFGENIYYTKDYWFANSHILALHADWS